MNRLIVPLKSSAAVSFGYPCNNILSTNIHYITPYKRRSRRIWSLAKIARDFRWRLMRRCGSFENSCDKIAQPDGLALLAIHSNKRRKSREQAQLANAGEFNRRYLACQISAILCRSRRSAYKIAKCVAGLRLLINGDYKTPYKRRI